MEVGHRWAAADRVIKNTSRAYTCYTVIQKRGTLGHNILRCKRCSNMAISGPKSTAISIFIFSCVELQPVGILSPMGLVHLLMHA